LPLQVLQIPQTHGKENFEGSPSTIKLNTRQFVKNVIQSQVLELTHRDEVFKANLKRFVAESDCFLANNEKHFRIKFVMDLVQALLKSIHEYSENNLNSANEALEREKNMLQQKVNTYKLVN